MNGLLMERLQLVKGIDPVADAFSGTVYSDVVDVSEFHRLAFVAFIGVGDTGTSTLTVQACDDTTPSNRTAIPFRYREILTGDTGDTEGAITDAASTGFVTTAGSSKIVVVEIDESALAATGYRYAQLKAVEVTNSPVLGGILVIGEKKRQSSSAAASAID